MRDFKALRRCVSDAPSCYELGLRHVMFAFGMDLSGVCLAVLEALADVSWWNVKMISAYLIDLISGGCTEKECGASFQANRGTLLETVGDTCHHWRLYQGLGRFFQGPQVSGPEALVYSCLLGRPVPTFGRWD